MIVVADASACASFLLPDEAGPFATFARDAVAAHDVHVPPHWSVEIASILRSANRRKRIDAADLLRLAGVATEIAATGTVDEGFPITKLVETGLQFGLTPYDAAYVALAQKLRGAILTTDKAMARACSDLEIEVLRP